MLSSNITLIQPETLVSDSEQMAVIDFDLSLASIIPTEETSTHAITTSAPTLSFAASSSSTLDGPRRA